MNINMNRSRLMSMLVAWSKVVLLLTFLYFFICSLSFLADSFRILGGPNIGGLFENDLLQNPVVGIMIGILVTVLVQSSSTSTSIIVGLVASGAAHVRTAIPMIMGANIGTSVTNTIVSFTQASNREEFSRAFACATIHDMFNWLTVIVMLIFENITRFLETITAEMVSGISTSTETSNPDFLKVLTNPFTKAVIQLNKKVLEGWAQNKPEYRNASTILLTTCKNNEPVLDACPYLFAYLGPQGSGLGDVYIGIILLVVALIMICGCLLGLVKCLNSLLGDEVKTFIEKIINTDIPIRGLGWLTGYLFMLLGAVITILVQSSSVFTSTLTPLAGTGLVSLERAYPMTLGSNIGTTTTSLLASFAAGGSHFTEAVQIALVHLFFNIAGIMLFYPIPALRFPIPMARCLGNVTAKYRWFALVYLLSMFGLIPMFVFGVSMVGPVAMYVVLLPLGVLLVLVTSISIMQNRCPKWLPVKLRDWTFLPLFLRSLEPYDRAIMRVFGNLSCCSRSTGVDSPIIETKPEEANTAKSAHTNFTFQPDEMKKDES